MPAVRREDVWRATLADDCGNIGFLGFAPEGSAYHVVAPVDLQLARSVKAGLRPLDGTPFGGYRGWLYFACAPYPAGSEENRRFFVAANVEALLGWAAAKGLNVTVTE